MRSRITVLLVAVPALAGAEGRISQSRPAAPDGVVHIDNPAGSIRVIGWDRAEVAVSGTLGHGAYGVDLGGDKRQTRVEVESEGNPHGTHSDLEVRVGEAPREVQAESVNGGVTVTSRGGRVQAESVNGPVTVRGAGGEIEASTVNGPLTVTGGTFRRARLETVNGRVLFEGGLAAGGTLHVESVSGAVELALPANTAADFTVTTFSGDIRNELGPAAQSASRHTTEKELTFSTGGGGANVTVETLSGSIVLRRRERRTE
jgi:hypothetical protein